MTKHKYRTGTLSNNSHIIFCDGKWEKRLGFYRSARDAQRLVRKIEQVERIAWNIQCNCEGGIFDAGDDAHLKTQRVNLRLLMQQLRIK
jgi:hypothetical protein